MRLITLLPALGFFALTIVAVAAPQSYAGGYELDASYIQLAAADADYEEDDYEDDEFDVVIKPIADPLEPFNRAMYKFNDVVFHSVIKPVAIGYGKILPEPARRGVNRFMLNLATPIRFVNSVLQLKLKRG